jgi:predicted nucleic acid-binding protein
VIYCDSSALVKLVVDEPESDALEAWLATQPDDAHLVSSVLARTEVVRAVSRYGQEWIEAATELLKSVAVVELDGTLADDAARFDPPELRSLDALHLASALRLGQALTAFVAYDLRLAESAGTRGLTVQSPR